MTSHTLNSDIRRKSYLVTFNFNHLFDTILDDQMTIFVIETNVTFRYSHF